MKQQVRPEKSNKIISVYLSVLQTLTNNFLSIDITGSRPLIQFYAYLYFEDWRQDLQMKRFMRDNLRFSDVIQCAAARIVEAVREIARNTATGGRNKHGGFDTMHVRRTDFKDLPTYQDGVVGAEQIVRDSYFQQGRTVYIATDEKDRTFFEPLTKNYTVLFFHDFDHLIKGMDPNYFGMIEQLVCAKGDKFVGTYYSTFTAYINRIRGYHAQKSRSEDALNGVLNSEYMGHDGAYRTSLRAYTSARRDFWSREWPIAWRDIDHDMDQIHS
jgi:GDP-fucose protein O-fucosyltransferase